MARKKKKRNAAAVAAAAAAASADAAMRVRRTGVGLEAYDEAAMFTAAHEPGDFDDADAPKKRRHLRVVK